jgi:hypothetical protein
MCNEFRGVGNFWDRNVPADRRTRHHFRHGVSWNDFAVSAASCEICGVLLSGCKGCFQQHGFDHSEILHCDISFYYESFEFDEEEESEDVDKEIFFRMKDGSWFVVQIFAVEDGR